MKIHGFCGVTVARCHHEDRRERAKRLISTATDDADSVRRCFALDLPGFPARDSLGSNSRWVPAGEPRAGATSSCGGGHSPPGRGLAGPSLLLDLPSQPLDANRLASPGPADHLQEPIGTLQEQILDIVVTDRLNSRPHSETF